MGISGVYDGVLTVFIIFAALVFFAGVFVGFLVFDEPNENSVLQNSKTYCEVKK